MIALAVSNRVNPDRAMRAVAMLVVRSSGWDLSATVVFCQCAAGHQLTDCSGCLAFVQLDPLLHAMPGSPRTVLQRCSAAAAAVAVRHDVEVVSGKAVALPHFAQQFRCGAEWFVHVAAQLSGQAEEFLRCLRTSKRRPGRIKELATAAERLGEEGAVVVFALHVKAAVAAMEGGSGVPLPAAGPSEVSPSTPFPQWSLLRVRAGSGRRRTESVPSARVLRW